MKKMFVATSNSSGTNLSAPGLTPPAKKNSTNLQIISPERVCSKPIIESKPGFGWAFHCEANLRSHIAFVYKHFDRRGRRAGRLFYLFSSPVRRNVIVPQNSRACICTGRCRSSSVYQIHMLPRFFTTPTSAVGCTRIVLKVPSDVRICS